jgi:lipopolysaccharide cholinephosphotransferase
MRKPLKHGKEITLEELKVLQMDVLSAIDNFCQHNNITYSMSNGTMLGAIRHKGYIPWDDDIDIYMLRDDYEKLMQLFPPVYNGHYCIVSLERSEKWDFPYAKAYDNRTVVYENALYNELYGVNIDIFPIDDVPDDDKIWHGYDVERRKLYNSQLHLYYHFPFSFKPKKFVRWIYHGLQKAIYSRRKRAEKINRNAQKWRGQGFKYVFETCQGVFQKNKFRKDIFNNMKSYPFEDRYFMGFENFDEYLRNGFGDYMKLPPVEKRITHHSFEAYWK